MSQRIKKINQLIKKELSQVLLNEFDFPKDVLVTLTRVETTSDLNETKVYISVMPEEESKKNIENLDKNIKRLQQKINSRLKMRIIPKIRFIEETTTREAARIEELLEKVKKDEKS